MLLICDLRSNNLLDTYPFFFRFYMLCVACILLCDTVVLLCVLLAKNCFIYLKKIGSNIVFKPCVLLFVVFNIARLYEFMWFFMHDMYKLIFYYVD